MILPSKHITAKHSLLGIGGIIVSALDREKTVSALWDCVRNDRNVRTFQRFVLALDLLYLMGVIDYSEGLVRKVVHD